MSQKKFEEKGTKLFKGTNPFTLSKLKRRECADELIVHKVSELMHALFTLKGKDKEIRCCPVNQLKVSAVQ